MSTTNDKAITVTWRPDRTRQRLLLDGRIIHLTDYDRILIGLDGAPPVTMTRYGRKLIERLNNLFPLHGYRLHDAGEGVVAMSYVSITHGESLDVYQAVLAWQTTRRTVYTIRQDIRPMPTLAA